MSLISLELNQARNTANTFQSSGQALDELRAQLQSQWTRLAATWEGHSHDLVEPEIQTLLNRCGQVAESARERGAKLAQIVDRFQAADENEPPVVLPLPWGKPDWPSPLDPGGRLPQPPEFPTLPIGEEGQHRPDFTTLTVGEEGQQPPEFTLAGMGEEGLPPSHIPRDPMTMLAVGEDGRQPPDFTTLAMGEEGQQPPPFQPRPTGVNMYLETGWEPPTEHRPKDFLAMLEVGHEPPSRHESIALPEEGFEPFPNTDATNILAETGRKSIFSEGGFDAPKPDVLGDEGEVYKFRADDPIEPPKLDHFPISPEEIRKSIEEGKIHKFRADDPIEPPKLDHSPISLEEIYRKSIEDGQIRKIKIIADGPIEPPTTE